MKLQSQQGGQIFLEEVKKLGRDDLGEQAESAGGLVAQLCPTLSMPWAVACQVPLSVGFSRQEYWSGLPFPSPGDLPEPGIELRSPAMQVDSLLTEPPGKLV